MRELLSFHGMSPRRARLSRGDLVSLVDPRNQALHLVASGAVKLTRVSSEGGVLTLGIAGRGELFGETALLGDGGEDAVYAEALEPSELEVVSRLSFQRLLQTRPDLGLRLAELLAARCSDLERRLESQIFCDVPTRLAVELLHLAERYGAEDPRGTRIDVRVSQSELGSLIGASREMVSLTLSDLRRRGVVVIERRRLIVRKAELRRELLDGRESRSRRQSRSNFRR